MASGCGDGACTTTQSPNPCSCCNQPCSCCCDPIRCGPLVSSVAAGDLACFCELQAEKKKLQEKMNARCRQLGEYDPCNNPCCRIPGQHPFCPPGQTIGILPKGFIEDIPRPVQKPCGNPPPRLPWRQCIENTLVNDQVRRPMGRWCHVRPLPPIVVPCSEIERMKDRIQERDRIKEQCAAAAKEREAARQASYQRHSEWNYTVDSLLARKRQEQESKERREEEEFQELSKSIKESRDKYSQEMQDQAKKQLLYQKGLIKDFHAAMAYSKALKDMQEQGKSEFDRPICKFKQRPQPCSEPEENLLPIVNEPCMKRMVMENQRPEYKKNPIKDDPCSEERLQLLKCDESRVPERQAELEKEKEKLKALRTECPLPWPETYLKYIEEPVCLENPAEEKLKKQQKMRDDIFLEIHDKLAADAFVEYHEKEIERQACEFNEYKWKVDKLRKEKQKQLIDDKVQAAIKNGEKAAELWKKAKAKQAERTDEYTKLKEIWEAEHAKKENMMKEQREGLEKRVTADFICRKDNALVKRLHMDATREWEKECCLAVENYERICERDNKRREKAKELAKYHLEQVKEKTAQLEDERFMNAVYGQKSRMNYACEMKDMKDYANRQIDEWKAKGRPLYPLYHAMKKWDYDAGMTPELYSRTPLCGQVAEVPCAEPGYESTAQRLGFDTLPNQNPC